MDALGQALGSAPAELLRPAAGVGLRAEIGA
jgi:hypothetical protein